MTLVELLIIMAVVFVLGQIVVPSFRAARQRANQRACYANQKTISGVLEMYSLDPSYPEVAAHGDFMSWLLHKGYLKEPPADPGYEPTAASAYRFTTGGDLYCENHGPIQEALPPTPGVTAPSPLR